MNVRKVFTERVLVLEDSGAGAVWPATCGRIIKRRQRCIFLSGAARGLCNLARKNKVRVRSSLRIRGNQCFGSGSTMCWFGRRRSSNWRAGWQLIEERILRPFSVVLKKKLTQIGGPLQATPSPRPRPCFLEAAGPERATGRSPEPFVRV